MADADECFNSGISSDIWKEIGTMLGFSAAAVAAATAVATAGAAPPAGGTAVTGAQGANLLTVVLAVGAGIAAIAAATVLLTPPESTGAQTHAAGQATPLVERITGPPSESFAEAIEEASTQRGTAKAAFKAVITIERETLRYSAGDVPDPARIIRDAGAKSYGRDGEEVALSVREYEQVDFARPDEYYVYLAAEGDEAIRRVVIISVEEPEQAGP